MKNKIGIILMGLSLSMAATHASASSVTIPTSFTAGTAAVAAEVNGNFDAVKSAVDDNDSRLNALESGTLSFSLLGLIDSIDNNACELRRSSAGYVYYNTGSGAGCDAFMPVTLPQGRSLISLSCTVLDNDAAGNNVDYGSLRRTSLTTGTTDTVFQTIGSTNSVNVQQLSDVTPTAGTDVIDNSSYAYFLRVRIDDSAAAITDIRAYGCNVTYQ